MAAAAVAAQLGGDPRWVLDAPLADWPIVAAVLELAAREHTKREAAIARYIAVETANRTVRGVSKAISDALDAWAKSQQQ